MAAFPFHDPHFCTGCNRLYHNGPMHKCADGMIRNARNPFGPSPTPDPWDAFRPLAMPEAA